MGSSFIGGVAIVWLCLCLCWCSRAASGGRLICLWFGRGIFFLRLHAREGGLNFSLTGGLRTVTLHHRFLPHFVAHLCAIDGRWSCAIGLRSRCLLLCAFGLTLPFFAFDTHQAKLMSFTCLIRFFMLLLLSPDRPFGEAIILH